MHRPCGQLAAALKGAAHRDYGAARQMPLQRYSTAATEERNGCFSYRTRIRSFVCSFVRHARENRYVSLNSTAILLTRVAPGASRCLSLCSAFGRVSYAAAVSNVTAGERRGASRRVIPSHPRARERAAPTACARRKARAGTRLSAHGSPFALVAASFLSLFLFRSVSSSIFQRFSCFSSLKLASRGS